MIGPEGALGAVLETMSWVGLVPGIPMLVLGWIVAARRCKWTKTAAEVFEAGGFQGFRWSDSDENPHLTLNDPSDVPIMDVGTQVELYYDRCHPSRWRFARPHHENHVLLIGGILTGMGILSTVAGFVLMIF
ncbi:MAG: hypothetical protein ACOH1K_01200 [Rhodoglobus sp.]